MKQKNKNINNISTIYHEKKVRQKFGKILSSQNSVSLPHFKQFLMQPQTIFVFLFAEAGDKDLCSCLYKQGFDRFLTAHSLSLFSPSVTLTRLLPHAIS